MKIRTDFVTNSSSSSFVTITLNNEKLSEILRKYEDLFEEGCCETLMFNDDEIEIYMDECYADVPNDKEDIIKALVSVFGYEYYDENEEFDEENCCGSKVELVKEIIDNAKEIMEKMEFFQISSNDMGWQGDSDSRYYTGNYDEETLKMYYEWIAEENNCTPEEVTEEMFGEWVSDKTSTDENTYTYNRETREETFSHSFTVE